MMISSLAFSSLISLIGKGYSLTDDQWTHLRLRKSQRTRISISIDSLPQRRGEYRFDFAIYAESRKTSFVHVSGAGPVAVASDVLTMPRACLPER